MKVVTRRVVAGGVSEILSSLGDGVCGLWLLRPGLLLDEAPANRFLPLLSAAELARYQRFLVPTPAATFLAARVLLRAVLSTLTGLPSTAIEFSVNSFGKPELSGAAAHSQLRFNLSHKPGLIALLISLRRDLGVDVEDAQHSIDNLAQIAARYFSEVESAELLALPQCEQKRRFYQLWTLKESYIKARGIGLSLGLSRFSFSFPVAGIEVRFAPELDDCATNWSFWQSETEDGHMLAATIEQIEGLHSQVQCWDEGAIVRSVLEALKS